MLVGQWTFDDAGNPGADTAGTNTAVFQADARVESGAAVFDGADDHLVVAPSTDFQHTDVTLAFAFTTNNAADNQGLVSRDSWGNDGGGHVTLWVTDTGEISVRHQSESASYSIVSAPGTIVSGQGYEVVYAAGPDGGMRLWVDGVLVGSNTDPLTDGANLSLSGNNEPWVFGASQSQSGDGVADGLQDWFDGSMSYVEIYNQEMTAAEVATAQSNPVPCFTAHTFIESDTGPRLIGELRVGDRVQTMDNGVQRLVAILTQTIPPRMVFASSAFRPVEIGALALGQSRRLTVSPQHGLLMKTPGGEEQLVRANHLARSRFPNVRRMNKCQGVTYIHLLFETHQILFANGLPTESFYPGPRAIQGLGPEAEAVLGAIYPDLLGAPDHAAVRRVYGDPARPYSRLKEVRAHPPTCCLPNWERARIA